MVADALSQKSPSMGSLAFPKAEKRPLAMEVQSLARQLIRASQFEDDKLRVIRDKVLKGEAKSTFLNPEGVLRILGRICVPKVYGWPMIDEGLSFLGDTMQRMPIPEWKWECIIIDFVVGFTLTLGKYDIVWVIVDRLTKSDHFIPRKARLRSGFLSSAFFPPKMPVPPSGPSKKHNSVPKLRFIPATEEDPSQGVCWGG
ncbi:uncharacterized protein [Solanum tuberosum]|uniref:uncharacterized protein n=1 Tax=Solanum tuberosum TaxID=4113 RepID=UPI00073A0B95|nr:PREDICTED: uncharacterized protein LOC107060993 [Solanum tuberosum]